MAVQVHELKTKEPFFSAVKSGAKTFEVRQYTEQYARDCDCDECMRHKNKDGNYMYLKDQSGRFGCHQVCRCIKPKPARDFQPGDVLILRNKDNPEESIERQVLYVLKDRDYPDGIKPGFCVLALKAPEELSHVEEQK